jgi:hypothetical protein
MNAPNPRPAYDLPTTRRLTSFGQAWEPGSPLSSTKDDVSEFLGQSIGTFAVIEPHVDSVDFSAPVFRCALTTLRAAEKAFDASQYDEADRLLVIAIGAFQATYDDAPSLGTLYAPFRAALHVAYCAGQALSYVLSATPPPWQPPDTEEDCDDADGEGQP